MKTTSDLLNEHFVKWQFESGTDKKQWQFAEYIGEDEKYLNMVMNGRKPSKRQTILFANFFQDPRFYDAEGMERPAPLRDYMQRNYDKAPENVKWKIAEELSQYTTEPLPARNGNETKSSHK